MTLTPEELVEQEQQMQNQRCRLLDSAVVRDGDLEVVVALYETRSSVGPVRPDRVLVSRRVAVTGGKASVSLVADTSWRDP